MRERAWRAPEAETSACSDDWREDVPSSPIVVEVSLTELACCETVRSCSSTALAIWAEELAISLAAWLRVLAIAEEIKKATTKAIAKEAKAPSTDIATNAPKAFLVVSSASLITSV